MTKLVVELRMAVSCSKVAACTSLLATDLLDDSPELLEQVTDYLYGQFADLQNECIAKCDFKAVWFRDIKHVAETMLPGKNISALAACGCRLFNDTSMFIVPSLFLDQVPRVKYSKDQVSYCAYVCLKYSSQVTCIKHACAGSLNGCEVTCCAYKLFSPVPHADCRVHQV